MDTELKKTDASTEERIKDAARAVFYRKGFAATRTRDIADEAGINHALLNYYFRSKAKLFEIIMMETFSGFVNSIFAILNDEATSLDMKVSIIANRYIDFILQEPEIPTFLLSEIRNNSTELYKKLPFKDVLTQSVFVKQHAEAVKEGLISEPNPLHFMMNLMGLIIFPFVGKPLLISGNKLKEEGFNQLMQDRKKLIPKWIKAMMGP